MVIEACSGMTKNEIIELCRAQRAANGNDTVFVYYRTKANGTRMVYYSFYNEEGHLVEFWGKNFM